MSKHKRCSFFVRCGEYSTICCQPRRWGDVVLISGHRHRRWPIVKLTVAQRLEFAVCLNVDILYILTLCPVVFTMIRISVSVHIALKLQFELHCLTLIYVICDVIVSENTNAVYFSPRAILENTALVQWIRCSPEGSHLNYWKSDPMKPVCTLFYCIPHTNEQHALFLHTAIKWTSFVCRISAYHIQMNNALHTPLQSSDVAYRMFPYLSTVARCCIHSKQYRLFRMNPSVLLPCMVIIKEPILFRVYCLQ